MTIVISFSGGVPCKRLCRVQASRKPALGSLRAKTTCRFGQSGLAVTPHVGGWRRERDTEETKPRKLPPIAALKGSLSSGWSPLSPSDTVKEFYACINEGKSKQLGGYISADCYIEECSFVAPFQGKEV